MGINRINEVGAGEIISPEDSNQHRTAAIGDVVPRDDTGNPVARSGSLGTEALPWRNLHVDEVIVGGNSLSVGSNQGASSSRTLHNGVRNGRAPANRPGMCGWLNQAGAAGITLTASTDEPLIIVSGGEEFVLTNPITGGLPLPPDQNENSTLSAPVARNSSIYHRHTLLANGGEARFTPISDFRQASSFTTYKFADGSLTGYVSSNGYRLHCQKSINISSDGYEFPAGWLPLLQSANVPITLLRPGFIFADPTTSPWTISIEKTIRGSVESVFPPPVSGQEIGDMAWRESAQAWYRYDGSDWIETRRVYLGVAVIDTGAVVGVLGVRHDDGLVKLLAGIDEWMKRPDDSLRNSRMTLISGHTSSTQLYSRRLLYRVESSTTARREFGFLRQATLSGQFYDREASAAIELRPNEAEANSFYFFWLDVENNTAFYDTTPPNWLAGAGRTGLAVHPQRNAFLLSTFATGNSAGVAYFSTSSLTLSATYAPCPFLFDLSRGSNELVNVIFASSSSGGNAFTFSLSNSLAVPRYIRYSSFSQSTLIGTTRTFGELFDLNFTS